MIFQLAKVNLLLAQFLMNAGWRSRDQVPTFFEHVSENFAAGIAQGRFKTSQAVSVAMVGGILIGILEEAMIDNHNVTLHFESTKALLRGVRVG